MRVVIFIHSLHAGGAERVTSCLANAWSERGWEVSVVTLSGKGGDFYALDSKVMRVGLEQIGNSGSLLRGVWANLQRIRSLRKVLAESRPNVVIGMMNTAAIVSILASRGLQCRVFACERIHPSMMPLTWAWSLLRRLTYPKAARVVMLSQQGLRWLRTEIPRAKGTVIPNPLPLPLPVVEPIVETGRVCAADRKVLLAVGRLEKQKGFGHLLSAFAKLQHRYMQWDLVILGEGSERGSLERQAAELGVTSRVVLLGVVGNIADWYRRADLFVMSSTFEGFPNGLAEAMAHGCPAVSYDCDTGPADIISHETNGLLVTPVGDVDALVRALDYLIGDDAERARMANLAPAVRERYSLEKVLELWDDLILVRSGQ